MAKDGKNGLGWWVLLLLAVLGGVALRALFVLKGKIDSDEAIVGLMGMEILKGHHFIFYWGQGYMGSLEAYAAALLFRFCGVSPPVLKAVPALFFLAAAGFHWLFARRTLGRESAAVLLGLFCWSPWVFSRWGAAPRGGYMEALALGGLALYLAVLIAGKSGRAGAWWYLLLGLVGGLGFWTHYLFVYYLVPIGLTILLPALFADGRWRRTGAFTTGFLAGVSPVIVYNLRHSFASLKMTRMGGNADLAANWANLTVRQLPTLLGANRLDTPRPLWPWASWLLLGLYALGIVWFMAAAFRRSRRTPDTPVVAVLLPLLVVATGLACFILTGFGIFDTERYLIPLYPLFALFLAVLLVDLGGLWKPAAIALGIFVATVNAYGNWIYTTRNVLPKGAEFSRETAQVLDYCRERGIKTAWGGHWVCYVLTFLSRQELVIGDLDQDRYEPFQELAAATDRPTYIAVGHSGEITRTLKAIGYRFEVGMFPNYTVYGGLALDPAIGPSAGRVKVAVTGTSKDDFRSVPGGIMSRAAQKEGLMVTFGLGDPRPVNGFIMSPGAFTRDYPRSFRLETSPDGKTWERVVTARTYVGGIYHLDRFRLAGNGWVTVWFPPRRVSQVRVSLISEREGRSWAVQDAWASLAASPAR